MAIRVFHCDDSASYRRLVHELLAGDPGVELVGSAGDAAGAVREARATQPDVVLVDLSRDTGLRAALRAASPGARILTLSAAPEADVSKRATPAELVAAIHSTKRR